MANSTNNTSEKLVQYLDGELSGIDKDDLEKQLAEDKNLQNELENLQLAREAVRSYGLKQHVAAIHNQMMNEVQTPVRNISKTRRIVRYSIAIAASVVIVFLASTIFRSNSLSSDKLFAENYHGYDLNISRDGAAGSAIENAYNARNYKQVTALTDTSTAIKNIFLSAMSYLELKDDNKAIEKYKIVIARNESAGTNMLKDEAEYFLSLTYLRNKDYDHALELMNKIYNDPGHTYHEKITGDLMHKVEKLK
jgi:tetratricopeptide (TPR) repeat protein